MTKVLKQSAINARNLQYCQNHLMNALSSKAFLANEGLNNEVPFHICPYYEPSIHSDITQLVKQLQNDLNNLQKRAKDKPTLMFFPREYQHSLESGASLVFFGHLQDDKYYPAFNILDRTI